MAFVHSPAPMMTRLLLLAALSATAAAATGVHPERAAQIAAHPSSALWTAAAHARFASQAPGASKSLLGVVVSAG